MRTETEILDLILRIAKVLKVTAVALSGSRATPNALKDEFQDYDVVYLVEDLEEVVTDLTWLDLFGNRMIEQHVSLEHRRLFLMLFEDGNRIDLTLCPKEHLREWLDSEADFTVLTDPLGLFQSYALAPQCYWTAPATAADFEKSCNEFWWVSAYVVKGIRRRQLIYAADHLYDICQKELLKLLTWQVAADKGVVDVGKNYKYLFRYLPAEKEVAFAALLRFSNQENLTQSLMATQIFFHQEAQTFSLKTGFFYDKETAEKMLKYTEEKLGLKD
ncbi:aminoglycoside 6-adenylyltransferase [Aggregatibacter kilianii]|uniref:aminoglycoside 6-adenylyltransferase n=1 Tax=Aggregatibacter kilianii TaxID=2025884 RepID=UPI000D6542D3|nr:aminoglycoside 6-adenylyltransferase [Aggregatibacter kilianii]